MSAPLDAARFAAAKGRFAAFFREISASFAERDDVIAQIALALLAREHMLFAGPPGTAKSALASSVVGRIFDEDTGRPSLYARQLTESTVQTDVIGPVDFKTLMETGRTQHFTDEGLLGAVHAFLDEVFDGRDMLLRSTLNLLHERELKQGTAITKGRFEIAFMTTNRYVSEVLESARETLLAFVDRVAFLGFVPRGFAEPSRLADVLRHEAGGVGRAPLEASLSVQDLDALQCAVDSVIVPDAMCDGLAKLLDLLEGELGATERADPTFAPTRYLSTRTAVRSAKILRAIVVHDAIFRRPDRPLSVEPDDLRMLRLHLLLSGPSPEQASALLARERDPRERRQLTILRAEREAFERALAKLPRIRLPKPRSASEPPPSATSSSPIAKAPAAISEPSASSAKWPPEWAESASEAIVSGDASRALSAMRDLLPLTRSSGAEGALATSLLRDAVTSLRRQAFRATLGARASEDAGFMRIAHDLSALADTLQTGPATAQGLARWVRGHALVLLAVALPATLDLGRVSVSAWGTDRDPATLLAQADASLRVLDQVAKLRGQLIAAGADPELRHEADAAWSKGLSLASEEVTALFDAALRTAATAALSAGAGRSLRAMLADVGAALTELRQLERRAVALDLAVDLRAHVVGPRLGPLLAHTFGRVEAQDRAAYLAEVDRTLRTLAQAGLADVIPASDWLTWAAKALLRADASAPSAGPAELSRDGYRALRAASPRAPNGFVLAEIAMRTAELPAEDPREPSDRPVTSSLLAALPADLRRDVSGADQLRIDRVVAFFDALFGALDNGAEPASSDDAAERLRRLVASGFFAILLDEGALTRTLLEIDLLRDLFPERADAATELRARLEGLAERARRRVLALARARGEGAWSAALRRASEDGIAR